MFLEKSYLIHHMIQKKFLNISHWTLLLFSLERIDLGELSAADKRNLELQVKHILTIDIYI